MIINQNPARCLIIYMIIEQQHIIWVRNIVVKGIEWERGHIIPVTS